MDKNLNKIINPPIRWAGSKLTILKELLFFFEPGSTNYIEPFLGSGSVLINVLNNSEVLQYDDFFVNDSNLNIVNFYRQLQNHPENLICKVEELVNEYNSLDTIEEKEELYYNSRQKFNDSIEDRDAIFMFLMKTDFNGVYRVNNRGVFNVPFGRKMRIQPVRDNLESVSRLIKNVHFYSEDYIDFLIDMKKSGVTANSLIYCDPPYIPDDISVCKTQTLYSKDRFNHLQFFEEINSIANHSSKVIISMSESTKADEIYCQDPFTKKEIKEIQRIVNPARKMISKEIIYTNIKNN